MRNDNNNNNSGHKGMMWMMIPCLILLGFLFLGGDKFSSGGYLWFIFIGGFVLLHILMMFKGHGGHGKHGDTNKSEDHSQKQLDAKNENREK